jgi:hypothetical protein
MVLVVTMHRDERVMKTRVEAESTCLTLMRLLCDDDDVIAAVIMVDPRVVWSWRRE